MNGHSNTETEAHKVAGPLLDTDMERANTCLISHIKDPRFNAERSHTAALSHTDNASGARVLPYPSTLYRLTPWSMPGHKKAALWTSSTECGEKSADIEEVKLPITRKISN